jgi:alcohol dehydrogenase class IV
MSKQVSYYQLNKFEDRVLTSPNWTTVKGPIALVRPPRVEFGPDSIGLLAEWVGKRSALVVSDAFNGARTSLLGLNGTTTVFPDVRAEPDIENLHALLKIAEEARPDVVIGFGGGSAMDLAKLAAVMTGAAVELRDIQGPGRAPPRKTRLVQIPTTAGTGSEAGTRALVTDHETRAKIAVESMHMLADFAIIDPALMISVPRAVTAATGVDAIAHCAEAFTNRRAHPAVDIYALEGIRLGGRYLRHAVEHGADIEARAAMAPASFYGGLCLGPVNTTAGHALAYPLGTRWNIPHGIANALIFPHVLAFNAPAAPERTQQIAEALQIGVFDTGPRLFSAAYDFCANLGIDMRLSAHGIERNDLPAIADAAITIRRLLDNNPREISRDEILQIYETAF